jgi:hypothetical protein
MALGDLDAAVPGQNGDPLDRNTSRKQFDGEGITEPMSMAVFDPSESKEPVQIAHVVSGNAVPDFPKVPLQKKLLPVRALNGVQRANYEFGQRTVDRNAGLLREDEQLVARSLL